MRQIGLLAAVVLVAGCAGQQVTKNQCLAGDWHTLGYHDGSQGVSSSRLLL